MYLTTFKTCVLKYMGLILQNPAPGLALQTAFKKKKVKLDLLTDIDTLTIVEKGIRDGICQSIHRFAKANNKYMKDYYKNKESSCLQYCDVNNLYG